MNAVDKLQDIHSIAGFDVYRQYLTDPAVNAYFQFLKKRLYNITQDRMKLLEQISYDYDDAPNPYIQFYYETLFGLSRTFGQAQTKHQYDTRKTYDDWNLYDDATGFDGLLGLSYYKILIKYLLSYAEEGYTLGWLYGFVVEFCNIDISQVHIEEHYSYVVVNAPILTGCQLLEKIFSDKQTYLNVPIEDIRFNLQ